jgi:hypothetical protein
MVEDQRKFEWDMVTRNIEHEREIYDRETRRTAAIEYARMVAARDSSHRQYSKEYGVMAVRSLILLNGGALISLVAFAGNTVEKSNVVPNFGWPVGFFVFGLISAVIAMALSFWNFMRASQTNADFGSLVNAIVHLKEWPHEGDEAAERDLRNSYNFAVFSCFVSLAFFAIGCALAAGAIS